MDVLFAGIGGVDYAHALARIAVGTFFAISGFHKLFNQARHATLVETLQADHVPFVRFNQWFVPMVEFSAGSAVVIGFLTPLAALGLFVICLVACWVDGLGRIRAYEPINRADWLDDLLYLPEAIYLGLLAYLICDGAGPFSLDGVILSLLP